MRLHDNPVRQVGPRLRRLVLEESDPWQPSVFHALRHCTSLERLKVSQLFVGTATLRGAAAFHEHGDRF